MSDDTREHPALHNTHSGEPEADERDLILDHNYDGIQEYDNPLPKWWIWLFIGSTVFAVGYFIHYQLGTGQGIHDDYKREVKVFQVAEEKRLMAMGDVTEQTLEQLVTNQSSIEKGHDIFQAKCTQCHGEAGQGNIGPNLTDNAWIHGDGTLMAIYETVRLGVVAKGMPSWERQLNAVDLRLVTAFVGSLRGTNLPGKAPEGAATEASGREEPKDGDRPEGTEGREGPGGDRRGG